MKKVSIQRLRTRLSALWNEAATGSHILITKHRRPLAVVSPPELPGLHVGQSYGRGCLGSIFERAPPAGTSG